jgi:hypothetical protein
MIFTYIKVHTRKTQLASEKCDNPFIPVRNNAFLKKNSSAKDCVIISLMKSLFNEINFNLLFEVLLRSVEIRCSYFFYITFGSTVSLHGFMVSLQGYVVSLQGSRMSHHISRITLHSSRTGLQSSRLSLLGSAAGLG